MLSDLREFLKLDEEASGQKINSSKNSFIISSDALPHILRMIEGTMGFNRKNLPFAYLGVPISKRKLKHVLFDGILAKVMKRLEHWSVKLL